MMHCEPVGLEGYEQGLATQRARWEQSDTLQALLDPDVPPEMVYLTYIQYCAIGTQLTRPVEGWIYRSGERCVDIGMNDLGTMLKKHSVHEKNHDHMMVKDTISLVERWNQLYPTNRLDADGLLSQPVTQVSKAYTALHEDVISGESPFTQIAIEYEIERLSVVLGPRLLRHVKDRCGDEFIHYLSFLDDHVQIDVVHTELNREHLDAFLMEHPNTLEVLIETGKKALDIYMSFFQECLNSANLRHRQMNA